MEGVPYWKLSSENQHTFNGILEKNRQFEDVYRQKSYFHFRLYTNSGGFFPMQSIFTSPDPGELMSPLSVRRLSSVVRSSIIFSHFNQLLWCHWANLNQTLVEWSLDGPRPQLCPVIPTSKQDGRQAQNRKKGGWNFNCPLLP
jgi:hypothetical protein